MVHQYSSSKEVIGNVIRNTRVQDSSFILDMPEWIGEAMSFMRTNMELVYKWKDVNVNFHIGNLPGTCVSVKGVEYNGCRLAYNQGYQYRKPTPAIVVPTIFQTAVIADTVTEPGVTTIFPMTLSLTEVFNLRQSDETYFTEMGCIKTSFCDGCVRVHYRSVPVDDEGFPLVPDNANYKQALYWHCRAMMIGAGYEDKTFSYEYCDAQYEKYAGRAIGQIRYPSTDIVATQIPDIGRFLPDNFLNFFGIQS